MGTDITLDAADGSGRFSAYCAAPAGGKGPGVVVIQEIFGVNADVRRKCDDWAERGYVALAPDLFWRQQPGIQLTDKTEAEWARAFELYQGFNVEAGVADLAVSVAAARARSTGKVGAVGYCLGGLLAYLAAARTDVDAAVGYYGVGIDGRLGEAARIAKPLMLHIACADGFVDADAQARLHKGLDAHPHVTLCDYPGLDHAFARLDGQRYDATGALLADGRTEGFFAAALKA